MYNLRYWNICVTWLKYFLCMVTEICASLQWNIYMLVIPLGNISSKVNKKIKFSSYFFEKKQIKMTYSHCPFQMEIFLDGDFFLSPSFISRHVELFCCVVPFPTLQRIDHSFFVYCEIGGRFVCLLWLWKQWVVLLCGAVKDQMQTKKKQVQVHFLRFSR